MGRHSAGNRALVDPIAAAALSQRATPVEPPQPTPAPDLAENQQDGGLGWPGEPGEGSGLGWPEDTAADDTTVSDTAADDLTASGTTAADTTVAALAAAPVAQRRSGWRRWFGGSPAVPPTPSGSTAA
ncbi:MULTISPECIES: hypothetical protein [unclassified Modestobacter]|uniref:hypothetical protein n=1 Tax=unclassified Modestobacter TaxID=2643866 RepID=UPI0022AA2E1A|nr:MULTISPECIES: hypothetical protein [unclassified Modestobacter]MCZ2823558.1 hypothetical protein [Modestobacter sp. VKM Ac-2981]MCZ2851803.1 hypothetical protein [Modestobacter sp. VKM Ac-2982]